MRPAGQIKARVRTYLTRHRHANPFQAGRFLHLTASTAHKYLRELCSEGVAHSTVATHYHHGRLVTFHAGARPVVMAGLPGRVFRDGVRL